MQVRRSAGHVQELVTSSSDCSWIDPGRPNLAAGCPLRGSSCSSSRRRRRLNQASTSMGGKKKSAPTAATVAGRCDAGSTRAVVGPIAPATLEYRFGAYFARPRPRRRCHHGTELSPNGSICRTDDRIENPFEWAQLAWSSELHRAELLRPLPAKSSSVHRRPRARAAERPIHKWVPGKPQRRVVRVRHRGAHLIGPRRAKPRGRPQAPDACASLRRSPAPPEIIALRNNRRDPVADAHRCTTTHPPALQEPLLLCQARFAFMSRLRTAQLAARTLWVAGIAVRALGVRWGVIVDWVIPVFIGADLVVACIQDPALLRRPSRSELISSVLGVLAMAALIVIAVVLAVVVV